MPYLFVKFKMNFLLHSYVIVKQFLRTKPEQKTGKMQVFISYIHCIHHTNCWILLSTLHFRSNKFNQNKNYSPIPYVAVKHIKDACLEVMIWCATKQFAPPAVDI